jgi:hypothetical protein
MYLCTLKCLVHCLLSCLFTRILLPNLFWIVLFQIVGVCEEELKAAQHWNGPGVIELLRSKPP